MTETLVSANPAEDVAVSPPDVAQDDDPGFEGSAQPSVEELEIARELARTARARGVALTGPDGMLKVLTKTVIETALDEEMSEHLGYDKHEVAGRNSGNSRNGVRTKTVLTDNVGPIEIAVPRDREGTFSPVIVAKRQRRLGDVDTIVLSLAAKGLTTGEISAHFAEIYGASLSKDTISRITDKVVAEMAEWASRPLEKVYAAVFIDAIYSQVPRRPGRQSPDLRRDRCRPGRSQGHPWHLGRRRWRGVSEVLAPGVDRAEVLAAWRTSSSSSATASRGCPTLWGPSTAWRSCRRA